MKKLTGQTLVEVMISLVILAIGVLALVRFQNYLAYDNSLAQQKNEATIIAVRDIETLRDFQVLNTTTGYTAYSSIASSTTSVSGTSATYTVTRTVTANTNPAYKAVNVVVSWTDRYNNAQSVTFSTNIAGIDPQYSSSIH
jgi:type IV pilus assembly protein PilV